MARYDDALVAPPENAYKLADINYEPDSHGASEISHLLDSLRKQNADLGETLGALEGRLQPVLIDRSRSVDGSEQSAKEPLRSPVGTALAQQVELLASFRWRLACLIDGLAI